jgi:PAS domain S-box-containing protein
VFLEVPGQAWPGSGLEDSDNLISEALESTADGVFVLDRDWNFVYLNSRAKETMPWGDITLLGRNHWETFPAMVKENMWAEYHRTMIDRIPTSFTTFHSPTGQWYDVQTYPAKLGISVFFRDVTGRKLKEQALRDSEERFRMIVDLNPQTPFTMSPEGYLTDFGTGFEELTGLSREETIGRGFLKAVHPDDLERVMRLLEDKLEHGSSVDFEWRALRKDGKYLWLRTRARSVTGAGGETVCYYGSTEDIDELKQLKASLRAAESALEEIRSETGALVLR